MTDELQLLSNEIKEKMNHRLDHLNQELAKIRAGKADPRMLDNIKIDYYGTLTPLSQISTLTTPNAKTISIQPWEKPLIKEIEKSIFNSDLGLNPDNNGETIIINIPPLTEERRHILVKQIKVESENAKIAIRNIRKEANNELKKMKKNGLSEDLEKDAEADIQKMTNNFSKKIDEIINVKEKEIMTV